jgi:nicotinic acid mononucleotide adenylyltransferase
VNADALDLIVGADLATQLDQWHESAVLRELVEVAIVPRPGSSSRAPAGWRSYEIAMQPVDLSSTFIREMDPRAKNLIDFIPASVIPLYEEARG